MPFVQSANAANAEQAVIMKATRNTARPAHGDAETRTRTLGTVGAAGTAESASERAVSLSHRKKTLCRSMRTSVYRINFPMPKGFSVHFFFGTCIYAVFGTFWTSKATWTAFCSVFDPLIG